MTWDDLDYWKSGEWDVIQEHLDDLDKKKITYCPSRTNLFAALDATPLEKVSVIILGQDPYPNPEHATGIAFSVPKTVTKLPVTLQMIFKEYKDDLHYPEPPNGCLDKWCEQGVLLWNVIPSCTEGQSLSHSWPEWTFLTKEILEKTTHNQIVVAALGSVAREYVRFISPSSKILETSHPSPRGNLHSKTPFLGSRLFSTINDHLNKLDLDPIDWRL